MNTTMKKSDNKNDLVEGPAISYAGKVNSLDNQNDNTTPMKREPVLVNDPSEEVGNLSKKSTFNINNNKNTNT